MSGFNFNINIDFILFEKVVFKKRFCKTNSKLKIASRAAKSRHIHNSSSEFIRLLNLSF